MPTQFGLIDLAQNRPAATELVRNAGRSEEPMETDDDRTLDDRTFTVVVMAAGLISVAVGFWVILSF
jgi:hypothetical protein